MVRERPPRLRLLRWLRSIFLMAQPPLLARRGIHSANSFTAAQTAATAMSSKRFFVFHVSGHGVEPVGIEWRRGRHRVEFGEFCVRQFHVDGFQIVFQLVWLRSSDDD